MAERARPARCPAWSGSRPLGPEDTSGGRSQGRALALAAISAGFLMITLDATIVNVALGAIGADLGGAPSIAQWVVDGYTVAFASLLLLAGSMADRIGVRRGFLVGLAVFVLASAACAVASSVAFLVAARVAQGIGAAWLMPCSLALIAHTFAEPHARRRALAVWGAVSGVGLASGPVVGRHPRRVGRLARDLPRQRARRARGRLCFSCCTRTRRHAGAGRSICPASSSRCSAWPPSPPASSAPARTAGRRV